MLLRAVLAMALLAGSAQAVTFPNYFGTNVSNTSSAALTSASSIGGSPTQIQYNSGGGFAGISGSSVAADGTVSVVNLSAANISLTTKLQVGGDVSFTSGRVAIGTVNPFFATARVFVNNTSSPSVVINNTTAGNGTASCLGLSNFTNFNTAGLVMDNMACSIRNGSGGQSDFALLQSNLTTMVPRLFIAGVSGNVGIGTSAPSATLHVSGTAMVTSVGAKPNCTTTNAGSFVYFSTYNTLGVCDGTSVTYILMVSATTRITPSTP